MIYEPLCSIESWMPIPGYENLYLVSDLGRIKRQGNSTLYNWKQERFLKLQIGRAGYPDVVLWKNNHEKRFYVHALVMQAFVGPRPEGYEINHKNGIQHSNRLENLEYVTVSANKKHRYDVLKHGAARGEQQGHAKLTEEKVRNIRQLLLTHKTQEIATLYGVTSGAIHAIKIGISWKHVK